MLDPDQLRDLQEFLEHRHGIDRPKRSEHLAEFESKESVAGQADRPVDIDNLGVGAADEVTALKDDRCSARRGDPVCFFSVVVQTIPGQVLDERAGDERPTIGPIGHKLKDLAPLGQRKQVREPGIHIDRGGEAASPRPLENTFERLKIDLRDGLPRKVCRGNSFNFPLESQGRDRLRHGSSVQSSSVRRVAFWPSSRSNRLISQHCDLFSSRFSCLGSQAMGKLRSENHSAEGGGVLSEAR